MTTEKMQEQRLGAWEDALARFRRVVDGNARSIDPGILETVVVLNLLSIPTTASCEGYLERWATHPWVDLGAADAETFEMEEQVYALNQQARLLRFQGHEPRLGKPGFAERFAFG